MDQDQLSRIEGVLGEIRGELKYIGPLIKTHDTRIQSLEKGAARRGGIVAVFMAAMGAVTAWFLRGHTA